MDDGKPDQPSWAPWAYIGTGIIGFLVVIFAVSIGRAGFFEAMILGLSVAVIVVGIKNLRAQKRS
jgi:hypothetical protein